MIGVATVPLVTADAYVDLRSSQLCPPLVVAAGEQSLFHTEDISHSVDDYVAGESEEHAYAFIDMGKSLDFSLYDSSPIATTPLYEGASVTILQAIANHLQWFSSHPGTSKEALSDILYMQHHSVLPKGNLLPDSYEATMKLVQPFLLKPVVFHACVNDCVVFRNEFVSLSECPKCKSPRYKWGTVPHRKLVYLPIGPRLERMFGTKNLAQLVQAHSGSTEADRMYDIHDSPMWKDAFSPQGTFLGDKRNIALGLYTDGVNPFSHHHISYSMWPIMLSILNFPRHLQLDFGNILLVGIIPGNGSKEPQTLSPYLEVVVDELLSLANIKMFDAYQQATSCYTS